MDVSQYIEHCRTAIYCNVLIRKSATVKNHLVSVKLLFNKQVLLWISLCSAWMPLRTLDAVILNDWFIVWIVSFQSWIGHCDWELSSWLPLHSQSKTCPNLDSLTVIQLCFIHFGDDCRFAQAPPSSKRIETPRQKTMTFDICKKKTWTTSCEFQASNHVMTLQLLGWSPPPTSNRNKWDQRRCLLDGERCRRFCFPWQCHPRFDRLLNDQSWTWHYFIVDMSLTYVVFSKWHPNNWDSLGFASKLHVPSEESHKTLSNFELWSKCQDHRWCTAVCRLSRSVAVAEQLII